MANRSASLFRRRIAAIASSTISHFEGSAGIGISGVGYRHCTAFDSGAGYSAMTHPTARMSFLAAPISLPDSTFVPRVTRTFNIRHPRHSRPVVQWICTTHPSCPLATMSNRTSFDSRPRPRGPRDRLCDGRGRAAGRSAPRLHRLLAFVPTRPAVPVHARPVFRDRPAWTWPIKASRERLLHGRVRGRRR